MTFTNPQVLLLVPAAAAVMGILALLFRRRIGSRAREILSGIVRLAILSLLFVALAGPHRPYVTSTDARAGYLPDESGSISDAGREEQDRIRAAIAENGEVASLPFGGPEDSDPRPALLLAATLAPDRVILATDGNLTADAAPLLEDLRNAGVPAGTVVLSSEEGETPASPPGRPRIVVGPAPREGAPIEVRVLADGAESVSLLVDGTLHASAAPGGDLPPLRLAGGRHELTAIAETSGRRSAAAAAIDVEGPLRVVLLGAARDSAWAEALRVQGIEVRAFDVRGPQVPDLSTARVVVALPEFRLPPDAEGITTFLRRGGGLLVVTGAAPGLARYRNEPIGDLLPAFAEPSEPEPAPPPPEPPPEKEDPEEGATPAEVEKEASTLSILLVVDRSGSMRGHKIAMARAACFAAARTLDPKDRIGVLAFSEEWEWIYRMRPAGELRSLRDALLRLAATGGTEIFPALEGAYEAMRKERSAIRHVILFSDGQDDLTGFKKLIDRMRRERITVSTVGVGHDYEMGFLGPIATWGAGRFYDATDPRQLPAVVTLDTRRVQKSAKPPPELPSPDISAGDRDPAVEEEPEELPPPPPDPVEVTAASPLPFLAGLAFPPLGEVEPATRRFPAQVALAAKDGSPVLSLWRHGAGRVALLNADTASWTEWPELPRFSAQLVRLLSGAAADGGLSPPAVGLTRDGFLVVEEEGVTEATLTLEDGVEVPLALFTDAPGRSVARMPRIPPDSLYTVTVGTDGRPPARLVAVAPPGPEDVKGATDAAGSSGVPPPPGPHRRPGKEPAHLPFLLVALALLPVDVAVRRLFR